MATDMTKYLRLFVEEATEHIEGFGRDLVSLERKGHSLEVVDSMFRHAHSVKGMAASMGFNSIVALSHRVEDLVAHIRERPASLTREVVDLLLEAGDRLLHGVRLSERGEELTAPTALIDRIAVELRAGAQLSESCQAPTSKPTEPRSQAQNEPAGVGNVMVRVQLSESCQAPGVRAFLVHKKLSALGMIVSATPSLDDCKAGRIPHSRLSLVVRTQAEEAAVLRVLSQIAELASVDVSSSPDAEQEQEQAAPLDLLGSPVILPPHAPVEARAQSMVRVRTELLDDFLDMVGELVLATSRLREIGRSLPERYSHDVEEGVGNLHRTVKSLHGKLMSVRMTPVAMLVDRLPRIVRDISRRLGREVEVETDGTDIELDRAILEALQDPLTHIIRNCLDHGIESPDDRAAAGKAVCGKIFVRARRDRARVIVEIEDDGRGIDVSRLKQAAVEKGLLSNEHAMSMTDREALLLCCLPGVSTSSTVSDLSGRGVGMDAVRRSVESLGGTLEIDSTLGKGTRFVLRLPLTVAVVPLLLVGVADEVVGLPVAKVLGAVEAVSSSLPMRGGAPLLPYGDVLVPAYRLANLLALSVASDSGAKPHVVVEGDGGLLALEVDRLLGQEEVVLKPLPEPLSAVPGIAGATILGTGRPIFVLDVPRLLVG